MGNEQKNSKNRKKRKKRTKGKQKNGNYRKKSRMWKDVATRRVTASERDLPTDTTKTWWHAERRVSTASSAAIAGEIDTETHAGDTQEATPRDERMTASIARSSSSSKTKFSSRNLNAVYKAPVSKSSESAGFPSANRMLVLRPVRGAVGVAKANTVAAPTPINTPSLRKENMGQDIHVNLVPSGRNGWGNEKNDEKSTERRRPSEPHEASEHQSSGENVWNGGHHGSPTTTLSQPSGNSAGDTTNSRFAVSSTGRWGDDAVEEDIAQSELKREVERQREYPDLHDAAEHIEHHHASQNRWNHPDYHAERPRYAMDDHISRPGFRGSPYDRDDGRFGPRYPGSAGYRYDHNSGYGPPQHFHDRYHDDRGYHHPDEQRMHQMYRPQDARYDGPVHHHDRYYGPRHDRDQDRQDHFYRDDRTRYGRDDDFRNHYGYASARYEDHESVHHRGYPQDMRRSHPMDFHDGRRNPSPVGDSAPSISHESHLREKSTNSPNLKSRSETVGSVWERPPPTTNEQASVWKMTEAEAHSTANVAAPAAAKVPSPEPPSESLQNRAPVRILKRNGPRMLFDHKTGTMVNADDVKPRASLKPRSRSPSMDVNHRANAVASDASPPRKRADPEVKSLEESRNVIEPSEGSVEVQDEQPDNVEESSAADNVVEEFEVKASEPSFRERQKVKGKDATSLMSTTKKVRPIRAPKTQKVVIAYRPVQQKPSESYAPKSVGPVEDPVDVDEEKPRQVRRSRAQRLENLRTKRSLRTLPFECQTGVLSTTSSPVPKSRTRRKERQHDHGDTKPRREQVSGTHRIPEKRLREEHTPSQEDESAHPVRTSARTRGGLDVDALKHVPIGAGVLVLDEDDDFVVHSMDEDDLGGFETVKSRRTILLERKRQRQVASQVIGGQRQRVNAFVVSTTSRSGKRTLVVGFSKPTGEKIRQSKPEHDDNSEVTCSDAIEPNTNREKKATPPKPHVSAPAPLTRSFIDVIRPPAAEPEHEANTKDSVSSASPSKPTRTKKSSTRRDSSKFVKDDSPSHISGTGKDRRKCDRPGALRRNSTTMAGSEECDAAKPTADRSNVREAETSQTITSHLSKRSRSTDERRQSRNPSTAPKPPKMVYVPKISQDPAPETPIHTAPVPVSNADCTKSTSPSQAAGDTPSRRVRSAASSAEPVLRTNTRADDDGSKKKSTPRRSSKSTRRPPASNVESTSRTKDATASEPKRRASKPHRDVNTKSVRPTTTQKVYKQVYVVKTAAPTSTAA